MEAITTERSMVWLIRSRVFANPPAGVNPHYAFASSDIRQYGMYATFDYQGTTAFAHVSTWNPITQQYAVKVTSTNERGQRRLSANDREYLRQQIWNLLNA